MIDLIDHIVDYPDLSEAEIQELRRAVARDAVLATLLARRLEIGAGIRETVGADDRRIFTLYALHRAGRTDDLSQRELNLVEQQADRFSRACADHPGIRIACEDAAEAAAAFSEIWDAHFNARDESRADDVETGSSVAAKLSAPGFGLDRHADDARPSHRHLPVRKPTTDRPAAGRFARRTSRGRRTTRAYRWVVRGAIAVAVVVFAVILTQVAGRDDARVTVETAEGQTHLVEMADGSRIRVLESSTFSYIDSEFPVNRRADLEGRAYFEIMPEGRGFLVETPTARITVLGTSFGIEARERITEVVLTDGRLTLARNTKIDDFVVLEPGQMSRVIAGSSPSVPIDVDVPRRLTWTGLFIFQSTPLSDIASLLGEHFGVTIKVADELASERVTGTFEQSRPLDEILRIIASAVGAHIAIDSAGGYALTHP